MIYAASVTWETAVIAYGVAAPFAAVCFWMMSKATKRAEKAEEEIKRLNQEMLGRDEQLMFRLWKKDRDVEQDRDSG